MEDLERLTISKFPFKLINSRGIEVKILEAVPPTIITVNENIPMISTLGKSILNSKPHLANAYHVSDKPIPIMEYELYAVQYYRIEE